MKLKKLAIGAAFTVALTMVVLLNQNKAVAQAGDLPSCPTVQSSAGSMTTYNQVLLTACGSCTVYKIRQGWDPKDGPSNKYETEDVPAKGYETSCNLLPSRRFV